MNGLLGIPFCFLLQLPSQWFTEPILPEAIRKSQMYAFVNANIPPLPRFKTLAEWQQYKLRIKPQLLRLLGIDDILAEYKLRVVQKGATLDREGYSIEKINYESFPGMWIPAVVWVPKGLKGKAPAAVSISGHNYCDSKATDYVQARAYNMVRRGFIVVTYDYFGTFERSRFDPCNPGIGNARDHRNSVFSYSRRTPTGIEVLDGIRAVDYLYSRPDVDRSRIAFTGESGGGNSTYWASALDDRITLPVPVSSAGAMEQWIKTDVNYDWHQRPPGLRGIADIGTLYALVAPRPLLVINGHPELEEFSLPDALRTVEYGKHVYRLHGKEPAILYHQSETGHGYQADKRAQLYRWLNRWFFAGKMPYGEEELPYQAEPKENFITGVETGSLSIPALSARWIEQTARQIPVPASGEEARAWQKQARTGLESLLSRRDSKAQPGVVYRYDYRQTFGGFDAERLQFEVSRDLLLPAILVRKSGVGRRRTIVLLEKHRGVSEEARTLLERGYALLLLDPRGTGEVDWGGSRTWNWANLMGRPPVGMWAEDISKVTSYLLGRPDVESVSVIGHGVFGKAAIYAMALDERIAAGAVTLDTASYREEAASGLTHIYADVPRILTWGDTAQLAALAAPRPLTILGAGVPVSLNDERNAYFSPAPRFTLGDARVSLEHLSGVFDWTSRFYRAMGAESKFGAGAAMDWTAAMPRVIGAL